MSEQEQSEERRIFLQALEIRDISKRKAWLEQACDGDRQMHRQIARLLGAHDSVGDFLESDVVLAGETANVGDALTRSPNNATANDDQVATGQLSFLAPCETPGRVGQMGKYEVIDVIGRGGMGIVLKAVDTQLNRTVAIKVMKPELAQDETAVRRFRREAQMAAAVRHDNIVTIYTVDESLGRPFLVMDYVEGETLKQSLARQSRLHWTDVQQIAKDVAEGLSAAHRNGLIHRDIKPANLIKDEATGRIMIMDFGLARVQGDPGFSRPGEITGTPKYMAPEQIDCTEVDHKSDLFSLGCVLYALCSGNSPFDSDNLITSLKMVCDVTPPPLAVVQPEIPLWFSDLVLDLLKKTADERPDSADEVLRRIESGASDSATEITTIVPPQTIASHPAPKKPNRTRLLSAIGVIATLVLIGLPEIRGYVVRLVRGESLIEIAVDDPGIVLTIDDDDYRFDKPGVISVTVTPGEHLIQSTRHGQPGKNRTITVSIGQKKTVTMTFSPLTDAALESMSGQGQLSHAARPKDARNSVWNPPEQLAIRTHSGVIMGRPSISADGLTVVFESDQPGTLGQTDLWIATRASRDDAFSTAVNLGKDINSDRQEKDPCLSADGLTLYFAVVDDPYGVGKTDLAVATRPDADSPFLAYDVLDDFVNSEVSDSCPSISADGLQLYFTSKRSGGYGSSDIWIATRSHQDTPFRRIQNAGGVINTGGRETSPHISSDGLRLYFASTRPGGFGRRDLWVSSRPSSEDEFQPPVNLGTGINSIYDEESPSLSADESLFLFESLRPFRERVTGVEEIWVTSPR